TIQPAFPQELKDQPMAARDRYERCMSLSRRALQAQPPPDVLVWPETMWPWFLEDAAVDDARKAWAPLVASGKVQLVLGVVWSREVEGHERLSNRAIVCDTSGRLVASYDKEILVPGGEAIPFGALLPAGFKTVVEGWIRAAAGFVVDL